uniref:Hydrophobic seed protein domain-containing protein n=1 Tax=Oryza punctata TaxID=4537 RepID=A0A0E0MMA5_ORYPU
MASRVSIVIFLAVVILPLLSFAQAQQPQTPPRRNPPRSPPSPRRAPPPPMTTEPTPTPVVAPSQPPIVAPAQPPIVAPTPSASNQCPRENIVALNLCTRLDLSTLLNNPTKVMQDCCPPLNSLSSTLATGCLCEAVKINLGVTANVLFLKAVLHVCGKAVLSNIGCLQLV